MEPLARAHANIHMLYTEQNKRLHWVMLLALPSCSTTGAIAVVVLIAADAAARIAAAGGGPPPPPSTTSSRSTFLPATTRARPATLGDSPFALSLVALCPRHATSRSPTGRAPHGPPRAARRPARTHARFAVAPRPRA